MTPRPLLLRPGIASSVQAAYRHRPSQRPFFSLPGTGPPAPQVLTATRTLPYRPGPLFDLIADIDSYSSFVPYCRRSRVTRWATSPSENSDSKTKSSRRWPAEADLHVGWGGFDDVFSSRVTCVPGESVEARSGRDSSVGGSQQSGGGGGGVFESLVTRWSFHPRPTPAGSRPSTEVRLRIQFQFANPLYAAVSAAVSDKVAGAMIEAFEERARTVLGDPNKVSSV